MFMNYVKELERVMGVMSTTYRGVTINHFDYNYWVNDFCFPTLEGSKKHIDTAYEHLKKSLHKSTTVFNERVLGEEN